MQFVKTRDGSVTAFNTEHGDHYHSLSGAMEEAFEKHVNALGIADGMQILDFCFGLGYNSLAACSKASHLKIVGLELDRKIVEVIAEMPLPPELADVYAPFRLLAETQMATDAHHNTIQLLFGDARQTIITLADNRFDRVYFDAFSPSKQPDLWTAEVFAQVYRVMKPGAKLSTYSCAKWIRANMKQAGFTVMDGPVIGRRSPATIGVKEG